MPQAACCRLDMPMRWSCLSPCPSDGLKARPSLAHPARAHPPSCRAFYRVWTLWALQFHAMLVVALWGWQDFYALSSICLTHALLSLLERAAGAWTQRTPGGKPFSCAALLLCSSVCALPAVARAKLSVRSLSKSACVDTTATAEHCVLELEFNACCFFPLVQLGFASWAPPLEL